MPLVAQDTPIGAPGTQVATEGIPAAGTLPWGMRLQIALLFPKLTMQQQKMLLEQKLKQMEQEQPQK